MMHCVAIMFSMWHWTLDYFVFTDLLHGIYFLTFCSKSVHSCSQYTPNKNEKNSSAHQIGNPASIALVNRLMRSANLILCNYPRTPLWKDLGVTPGPLLQELPKLHGCTALNIKDRINSFEIKSSLTSLFHQLMMIQSH